MPVYDYTYQTWKGERRSALYRWMAIPKFTYAEFFRKRFFIWLFTMAWLQFLLRIVYIYLLVNAEFLQMLKLPVTQLPPIGPFFFKNLIDVQVFFCLFVAFSMGSGLISRDMRHAAAVLYMSKPISRWEYFVGKALTLFSLMMAITWLQAVLLYGLQIAVAPASSPWRVDFWSDYAWIFKAITIYSTVGSLTLTLMILAASSLTKNSRYAGIAFATYVIGSSVVAGVVSNMLGSLQYLALSPIASGLELGLYLFRMRSHQMTQGMAWLGVAGVFVLSALILKRRLDLMARYGR